MEARNNSSPLARTGKPKMASRHRQRCHPVLVDKRAAPVGTAIREDLHVGEVGQGAAGERLILLEEPPLDLDEKVRPPLHARAEPADEFLSFKLIRYLSCPASHHHRAARGKRIRSASPPRAGGLPTLPGRAPAFPLLTPVPPGARSTPLAIRLWGPSCGRCRSRAHQRTAGRVHPSTPN